MFHMYNNKTAPIAVDAEGLDPEHLPSKFKLVYITLGCQFPSMVVMTEDRRRRLISKAKVANALVVEDDYEIGLVGHVNLKPALKSLDKDGIVVYVGSLSKTLSPSIRMGFMAASRDIIQSAKTVRS